MHTVKTLRCATHGKGHTAKTALGHTSKIWLCANATHGKIKHTAIYVNGKNLQKNSKNFYLIGGSPHSHWPQLAAFFGQNSRATQPNGIQTRDILLTHNLIYHCTTLTHIILESKLHV